MVAGAAAEPLVEPDPEPPVEPEAEVDDGPEPIEATGELLVIQEDDLAATGEHKGLADEVAADDVSTTGEVPVIAEVEDPPARPYMEIEDPPDGPVPEDIIARFAEMVQAEEERAAERAARERGDAG